MKKSIKKRNWCFIVYPTKEQLDKLDSCNYDGSDGYGSAPDDWIEILKKSGVEFAVSPLHDKDLLEDNSGKTKKPHYHVIVCYGNTTTFNNVVKSFYDKIISSNEFIRTINQRKYHIKNGKPFFLFERIFANSFINALKTSKALNTNYITLDIETYLDENNKMNIYCISFFDGKKSNSYYITDFKSTTELIHKVFKILLVRKNNHKNIYIHNSSNFDLIFLLKNIAQIPNITLDPIIKDGNFINLKIIYGPKKAYYINLKDSFLLLPVNLSKLAKQFNVKDLKTIFPHSFVNENNLNYKGIVPSFNHFGNFSLEDYNNYCTKFNNNWDLKLEAIKYCEIDCISLYQVIETFSKLIYKMHILIFFLIYIYY